MPNQIGRPRKPHPLHPNRVLAQAIKTGLSTAVHIQHTIKNSTTKVLSESSRNIWLEARNKYLKSVKARAPDFDLITRVENNIRRNSLQILCEKAAAYGNKEVVRAKSPDDTVGPLNQRFNIGGAALREFAMTLYPFPYPVPLKGDGVGYGHSSHGPEVKPIHVTLPEMDFIDSLRQHIQILNTHCYIFDVPNNDTRRYCNLFLLRARPYLDYIYTEHKHGLGGFRAGTLRILRSLKNEIAELNDVRTSASRTVTSELETLKPEFSTQFFRGQIDEANDAGVSSLALIELERILEGGSITETALAMGGNDNVVGERPAPCLTENDVQCIWESATRLSRRRGSQTHRHIAKQFPSFWTLRRAVLNDELQDIADGYMLAAEIPLETDKGKGRADLILFRREATSDGLKALWRPALVLDVKTRLGFFWELNHEEKDSDSRRRAGLEQRVVVEFPLRTRALNQEEWKAIIESGPHSTTIEQVGVYADAILREYQSILGDNECPPILKGTLYLDAEQDLGFTSSILRSFAIKVYESLIGKSGRISRTLFEPTLEGVQLRTVIVIHEQEAMTGSESPVIPLRRAHVYDPLTIASYHRRRFILYLGVKSPTSSGESAAWISKYYHGLQMLHQHADQDENASVVWLDLADEFAHLPLAETRLRLRPYSRLEDDAYRSQPEYIREFFDSIKVVGLSGEVQAHLLDGSDAPSLQHHVKKNPKTSQLLVVSGWDRVRDAIPAHYRSRLNRLLASLVDQLPDNANTTVVWFDSPVPAETNSTFYSTRTLLPFYDESPLFGEVTDLIWNMPVAPEKQVDPDRWKLPVVPTAPHYDDIRVVVSQHLKGYEVELAHVPPLMGWSHRFRSEGYRFRQKVQLNSDNQPVPDSAKRARMKLLALDLIPWLPGLWPDISSEADSEVVPVLEQLREVRLEHQVSLDDLSIKESKLKMSAKTEPSILQRTRFRPKGFRGGMSYHTLTTGRINSQRLYRSPNELKTESRSVYRLTRPTPVLSASVHEYTFARILELEDEDNPTALLVVEDPHNPWRISVGLFTERSKPDESGFIWSENDVNQVSKIRRNLKSAIKTDLLLGREDERLATWEKKPRGRRWKPRSHVEFIIGNDSRLTILRAIKETEFIAGLLGGSQVRVPSSFNRTVTWALENTIRRARLAKSVTLALSVEGHICRVTFTDAEDNSTIHEVEIEGTSDLIGLLRWPFRLARPMPTPSAIHVVWDPFCDIQYGELECIKSFVETAAPRNAERSLPSLVKELVEPTDERTLTVKLFHVREECPLVQKGHLDHGACWRLRPTDSESGYIEKLFDRVFTGKQVYGFLSSGSISEGSVMYSLKILLGIDESSPDFYVYHENYWIRRLLKEKGRAVKPLVPGAFLQAAEEKWIVSFTIENNWFLWEAASSITGALWGRNSHGFKLEPALSLDFAVGDCMKKIAQNIGDDLILNQDSLAVKVRRELLSKGWERNGARCRLRASRRYGTLKIELLQEFGSGSVILHGHAFILEEGVSSEEVVEQFRESLLDGDLSEYTILNESEFLDELITLLDETEPNN